MALRIVAENLVKRLGGFILSVDHLEVERGVNVVIGPNGSGKTTLLKLLAGLLRPNKGSIYFEVDGKRVRPEGFFREISVVMPEVSLPNLRVRDLIRMYTDESVDVVASDFNLKGVLDKRYGELSSGYKRRVQIAIAFSKATSVIILDEPFINVDSTFISILEEKILEASKNRILLVSSHVPSRLITENLIVMNEGRIVFKGRIPELPYKLVSLYVEDEKGRVVEASLGDLLREKCDSGMIVGLHVKPLQETIFTIIRGKKEGGKSFN